MLTADRMEIYQILQMPSTNGIGTYLGCTNIDKEKKDPQDFEEVKRRI